MDNRSLCHWGIKGMKWGVRRYQNSDGSLTDAGKKRYDRDVRENKAKKKDNRIDVSEPDPKRWAKEDLDRTKKTVDATSKLVNQVKDFEKETRRVKAKEQMDLSNMTDQELRQQINRKLIEKQYRDLFADENDVAVSSGREVLSSTLEIAGSVLAVTGSALSIALAIRDLKG